MTQGLRTSSRNAEVRALPSRANRRAPWRANGTTGSSRGTRLAEKNWEQARDQVQSAMREAIGEKQWEENDPNELWEHDEKLREALRPLLADVGETAQFLAAKAVVPNNEARVLFLDFLYKDLAAALKRLCRMSEGDYSPDEYRERFPKSEGADGGETANAAIRAVG